jgi:hypothetical protein
VSILPVASPVSGYGVPPVYLLLHSNGDLQISTVAGRLSMSQHVGDPMEGSHKGNEGILAKQNYMMKYFLNY